MTARQRLSALDRAIRTTSDDRRRTRQHQQRDLRNTSPRDYRRLQNRRRRPYEHTNAKVGGTARIPLQAANALNYGFDCTAWIDYR